METQTKTEQKNLIVIRNKDDKGRLLTYQIIDINKFKFSYSEAIFKEFNTLKELNKYLKEHPEVLKE